MAMLHPGFVKGELVFRSQVDGRVCHLQERHCFGWFMSCVCYIVCQSDRRDHRVQVWNTRSISVNHVQQQCHLPPASFPITSMYSDAFPAILGYQRLPLSLYQQQQRATLVEILQEVCLALSAPFREVGSFDQVGIQDLICMTSIVRGRHQDSLLLRRYRRGANGRRIRKRKRRQQQDSWNPHIA